MVDCMGVNAWIRRIFISTIVVTIVALLVGSTLTTVARLRQPVRGERLLLECTLDPHGLRYECVEVR